MRKLPLATAKDRECTAQTEYIDQTVLSFIWGAKENGAELEPWYNIVANRDGRVERQRRWPEALFRRLATLPLSDFVSLNSNSTP